MSVCHKKLNISTWNARSIKENKTLLEKFLDNRNVDIMLVTETYLKPNISLSFANHICYRNDRLTSRGGGVAILIKKI
jgi:exonuclease III